MTSSTPMAEISPPECPVCLEPYESYTIIPRVLACGHSVCELCVARLPRPSSLSSSVVRCPVCTQLINFSHHPTALPKNIDLLQYSLPSTKPHPKKPLVDSPNRRRFPPKIFSPELFDFWKDWVLPEHAVLMDREVGRVKIRVDFDLGLSQVVRCRLVDDQEVGLVEIGRFGEEEDLFDFSYVSKVASVLSSMIEGQRSEIGVLLGVSVRLARVCGVLGLWLDVDTAMLYLVIERKNYETLSSGKLVDGDGEQNDGLISFCSMISIELCELFYNLQLEGFVCGFLGLHCFRIDEFGHVYVDLGEVLVTGRKIHECVWKGMNGKKRIERSEVTTLIMYLSNMDVFISPEVLLELLHKEGVEIVTKESNNTVDYSSDVWLIACVFLRLITGKQFVEGMYEYFRAILEANVEEFSDWKILYLQWVQKMRANLANLLGGSYSSLQEILLKCLDIDPASRPLVTEIWRSIRGSNVYHCINHVARVSMKERSLHCLILGELCNILNGKRKESAISGLNEGHDTCETVICKLRDVMINTVVEEISAGKVQFKDLHGHLDCITSLCVGGGYLFSTSYDKTINVWSLQDFTHVHTFRGHEHKVMAVVFVHQEKPLCISADNGGGIFFWEIEPPFGQEPLKKWYEEKDWRYSGIHALAVSESGCLYTGSGDRLIKAWSLRDYTLLCSMEGHKSVVSTLALCNGVLYSGSWDGTVRLWSLHDYSPLAVFGEGTPVSSVRSLHADRNTVLAAHENGCIKIWMNDELKSSRQGHDGAIFALSKEEKWVFTGGWDRTVKVQEINGEGLQMETREVGSVACDSVITALLYKQGMLFIGLANKLIKVSYCES